MKQPGEPATVSGNDVLTEVAKALSGRDTDPIQPLVQPHGTPAADRLRWVATLLWAVVTRGRALGMKPQAAHCEAILKQAIVLQRYTDEEGAPSLADLRQTMTLLTNSMGGKRPAIAAITVASWLQTALQDAYDLAKLAGCAQGMFQFCAV